MPGVGTELCGQVAFGGEPVWVDVASTASGRALCSSGIQRIAHGAVVASGAGKSDAAVQRLPLLAVVGSSGRSEGTCRFVHLVSVRGEADGKAQCKAFAQRIVQQTAESTGASNARTAFQRLLQCAADVAGESSLEARLQRCPQLLAMGTGTSRAWFVNITAMGGASQHSLVQRIVQHALDARIQSAQSSLITRLCQCRGNGEGGASCRVRASLLPGLRIVGIGSALPSVHLRGLWTLTAAAKAQAEVEGSLGLRMPLHPAPAFSGTTALCKAQGLAFGIGPALYFPETAPESGVILFEVEQ